MSDPNRTRRLPDTGETGERLEPDRLARYLPDLLASRLNAPVSVGAIERLKGGYSRQMWAFETLETAGAVPARWILCADSAQSVVGPDSLERVREAKLLQRAHQAGLLVPAVLLVAGADNPFDMSWFVMARLEGTASVGPLRRDPWYQERFGPLAEQKAIILAGIHRLAGVEDILGPAPAPGDVANREIQRWALALEQTPGARSPVLERALGWLGDHLPPAPPRISVVHGDFRTGNLLYDQSGWRGVLDWEMAHLGDPLEDVAWAQLVCWRLGTGNVGGLVDKPTWRRHYEAAAARSIDPEALRFWEVLGSLKMSLLAWRAFARTPEGPERDLLERLYRQLGTELEQVLLA